MQLAGEINAAISEDNEVCKCVSLSYNLAVGAWCISTIVDPATLSWFGRPVSNLMPL